MGDRQESAALSDAHPSTYGPMTLDDLAELVSDADEQRRWLYLAEFLTEYSDEPPAAREGLIAERPRPTGSPQWDALLGALAEHLAFHDELHTPAWVSEPDRFLDVFWFPTNTPAARAEAMVHAPASFLRRGVFVERRSLERA
jgi:hypothetical protein